MKNNIKVQKVCYSDYIKNVSFSVNESECVLVQSENIMVLPTIVSSLAGIINPDKGTVLIGGKKASESNVNIGIFYKDGFFKDLCRDTITCPGRKNKSKNRFAEKICINAFTSYDKANRTPSDPAFHYIMINHLLETYGMVTYKKADCLHTMIHSLTLMTDIVIIDYSTLVSVQTDLRISDLSIIKQLKILASQENKICIVAAARNNICEKYVDRIIRL